MNQTFVNEYKRLRAQNEDMFLDVLNTLQRMYEKGVEDGLNQKQAGELDKELLQLRSLESRIRPYILLLVEVGKKIRAIKLVRDTFGRTWGIKDAKDYVENLILDPHRPFHF